MDRAWHRRLLELADSICDADRGGAPVPGGRPNAEPGGGRASGAVRRRLDLRTAQFGSAGVSTLGVHIGCPHVLMAVVARSA
jgi:hypothetical protein